MSNRIILNTTSFHGKGAINEIPSIVKTEPLPPKGGRFNQRLKPPKVG